MQLNLQPDVLDIFLLCVVVLVGTPYLMLWIGNEIKYRRMKRKFIIEGEPILYVRSDSVSIRLTIHYVSRLGDLINTDAHVSHFRYNVVGLNLKTGKMMALKFKEGNEPQPCISLEQFKKDVNKILEERRKYY